MKVPQVGLSYPVIQLSQFRRFDGSQYPPKGKPWVAPWTWPTPRISQLYDFNFHRRFGSSPIYKIYQEDWQSLPWS